MQHEDTNRFSVTIMICQAILSGLKKWEGISLFVLAYSSRRRNAVLFRVSKCYSVVFGSWEVVIHNAVFVVMR